MYFICNTEQLEQALRHYCQRRYETHDRAQMRAQILDFLTSDEARAAKIVQGENHD